MPRDRAEADALMSKSIEDILVCIHDEPGQDEHTKLGRMVREVSAHLVPFGHYTSTERVRIARALRDKNLGTQLSDRIADMIHNTSRRRRA
jgi:hypothetical protein